MFEETKKTINSASNLYQDLQVHFNCLGKALVAVIVAIFFSIMLAVNIIVDVMALLLLSKDKK